MLGQKLKELLEEHHFVQREVAAKLLVDTAYVSKMENGTKQISRSWLPILAEMFKVPESDLVTLWITDKIERIIEPEEYGKAALAEVFERYDNMDIMVKK